MTLGIDILILVGLTLIGLISLPVLEYHRNERGKRGLYEDAASGWWMHADINAAVNLVKLELNKLGLDDSRWWKKVPRWKLSNPRRLIKNALLSHLDQAVSLLGLCPKEELAPALGGLRFEVAGQICPWTDLVRL